MVVFILLEGEGSEWRNVNQHQGKRIHVCWSERQFERTWGGESVSAYFCFIGLIWLKMKWYEERFWFHYRYGLTISNDTLATCNNLYKIKTQVVMCNRWLKHLFLPNSSSNTTSNLLNTFSVLQTWIWEFPAGM